MSQSTHSVDSAQNICGPLPLHSQTIDLGVADRPAFLTRVTTVRTFIRFTREGFLPTEVSRVWDRYINRDALEDHLNPNRFRSTPPGPPFLMSFYASFEARLPKHVVEYARSERSRLFRSQPYEDPDMRLHFLTTDTLTWATLPLMIRGEMQGLGVLVDTRLPQSFIVFSGTEICRLYGAREKIESNHWFAVGHIPITHVKNQIQVSDGRLLPLGRPFKLNPKRQNIDPPPGTKFSNGDPALLDIHPFDTNMTFEQQKKLFKYLCDSVGIAELDARASTGVRSLTTWNIWSVVRHGGVNVWCSVEECNTTSERDILRISCASLDEMKANPDMSFLIDPDIDRPPGGVPETFLDERAMQRQAEYRFDASECPSTARRAFVKATRDRQLRADKLRKEAKKAARSRSKVGVQVAVEKVTPRIGESSKKAGKNPVGC